MGYTPNPLVSALMVQRRSARAKQSVTTLALVHCLPWESEFTENMLTFHQSVSEQAERLGYEVESFYLNEPGMTLSRLMNIIRSRGIRGIIWEHFFSADNKFEYDFSEFACVRIGNSLVEPAFHQIESDRFAEMRLALAELGKLGYRRLGYCSMRHVETYHNYRRLSALLLEQSLSPSGDRVPWLEVERRDDLESAIERWLKRHHPQVVISQNIHVYDHIRKAGYNVPQQVGFLHLGIHPSFSHLAGIDPNWAKRGALAVDRVIRMLNRSELGVPSDPLVTYVDHKWTPGPSLRKVGDPREPIARQISEGYFTQD
jgi:LacI family transcriptional regulator